MSRENFIIWQYRTKPKALGTIRAIYTETDNTFKNVVQVADILNIDNATGHALDLVGKHVGVPRALPTAIAKEYFGWLKDKASLSFGVGEFYRHGDALHASVVLNDNDYRFFIKARITKNYQTGEISNIVKSIKFMIGEHGNIIDAQDMTMNVLVNGDQLNSLTLYAISKLDILARPVGVMYQYLVLMNNEPFGFMHDKHSYGFNLGKFVRLQEI
ncbi:MAG: DUF2612 domain-containing protein [Gilliamella sp.]|uniref:DUF2612 domain-containing protein n=1 Tax=Gilliamella sp. TaxID=1891236 RepID=UPI0025FE603C|nr:DUF2612 domain-containing protein [Gilliamella sp.]MCO6545364.1 DUF2612 domain-containing protein [Gilliamella sp.]MCO6547594.1 DUF2612 domain-containing protein [Gilliamella sp.]